MRRGACPGLSTPMPTGDGLLVRLTPAGTIPLDTSAALCGAAQWHGNGVIEITSRGNIQVRGLSAASAPRFAADIAALDIAAADGVPILASPLAGLDPDELFDAGALANDLRQALAARSLAEQLSPKVFIVVDGGGVLSLDQITADVRAKAELVGDQVALRLAVGGDDASAIPIGSVTLAAGVEAIVALLRVIAQGGRILRARDVVAREGAAPFQDALRALSSEPRTPCLREARGHVAEVIGVHRLRKGLLAFGVELAFGHTDAISLRQLIHAARAAGASGVRTAPGRALIAIGLTEQSVAAFAVAAQASGFITTTDDPRRRVVACAGAPVCASAYIASRAIAPALTAMPAPDHDGTFKLHISGCAKGCAHPRAAALTVVGTPNGCALVAGGSSRDLPFMIVPVNDLPAAVADFTRVRKRGIDHV